ncbi:unnamed protein product [Albugo candida]|uniref:Uncharacterized protein n=1 Tax=Albugo candida TaxID=65357 RepID=A0A024GFC7_9STRA|nr:unnamed protein product [Albugo candida]|eukprot:CCI45584.1 unnamed protein product [Albugo candida]
MSRMITFVLSRNAFSPRTRYISNTGVCLRQLIEKRIRFVDAIFGHYRYVNRLLRIRRMTTIATVRIFRKIPENMEIMTSSSKKSQITMIHRCISLQSPYTSSRQVNLFGGFVLSCLSRAQ